jgi:hypothetical protein
VFFFFFKPFPIKHQGLSHLSRCRITLPVSLKRCGSGSASNTN